jgi:hypothetical protein
MITRFNVPAMCQTLPHETPQIVATPVENKLKIDVIDDAIDVLVKWAAI